MLRPSRPLPPRFCRPVSRDMRSFAERRHERRKRLKWEKWQRLRRRSMKALSSLLRAARRWFLLFALTSVLLAAGLIVFSPLVQVRRITIFRRETRLDTEAIQTHLRPLFGRHLLFLPERDVEQLVKAAVPDAEEVAVGKRYPSILLVRVKLRPLVARLLISEPARPVDRSDGPASSATLTASGSLTHGAESGSSARRYDYLTDNGIYVSLPTATPGARLPAITIVDWAVRPVPQMQLFPPEMLERMRLTEQALTQQFGQRITGRTVYLRAREFHVQTGNVRLWFDLSSPLSDVLERYRIFLKAVGLKDVKQYIDLRLAERVVYR